MSAERSEDEWQGCGRAGLAHQSGGGEAVLAGDGDGEAQDGRVEVKVGVAVPVARRESETAEAGELRGDFCREWRVQFVRKEVAQTGERG